MRSLCKNALTIFLLITFFPLGILLMWLMTKWPQWLKITVTIFFSFILFIFSIFFILFVIRTFLVSPHKVVGNSMLPTLANGQYFIADLTAYRFSDPLRGDIITYKSSPDNGGIHIGRIVGLPGESLQISGGNVYINNEVLPEPYLSNLTSTEPDKFIKENTPITIPPNKYIVLGDNRKLSQDSRYRGFVSKENILGRYWLSY